MFVFVVVTVVVVIVVVAEFDIRLRRCYCPAVAVVSGGFAVTFFSLFVYPYCVCCIGVCGKAFADFWLSFSFCLSR